MIDDFTDPWKSSTTETILIQPGFGRHSAFFYHWIPALARHYRVVRRDLRGHGLSSVPGPDYDYSLDTILGEMVDTIDQLGVEKVHVLGESTGGMLAVAFAGRYHDRCHSLTTCAVPTHLPASFLKEQAQGREDWETACRTMGTKGIMRGLANMPGGLGQTDQEYSKWWMEQVGLTRAEGLARYAKFLSSLDVRQFHQGIREAKLPVLILAPTRSRNTNLEDQMKYKETIPDCRIVEIDGRGHEIFVDKAEECQKTLLDFLREVKKIV